MHCPDSLKQIYPEMKLRGHVPNFYIHVSVSDLLYIFLRSVRKLNTGKKSGPIVEIHKSLIDT
jgi:hypothetical protein